MFEVWFSYRGSRRWRVADGEEQRDAAVADLESNPDVTDIDVIDLGT